MQLMRDHLGDGKVSQIKAQELSRHGGIFAHAVLYVSKLSSTCYIVYISNTLKCLFICVSHLSTRATVWPDAIPPRIDSVQLAGSADVP